VPHILPGSLEKRKFLILEIIVHYGTCFFKEEYVLANLKHVSSFCKLLLEMKMKFERLFIYVSNNITGRTCLVGSIPALSACRLAQQEVYIVVL